MFHEGYRLI